MRLRDALTIDLRDLPRDAMRCVADIVRREGTEASAVADRRSGAPVFASADADAAATRRMMAKLDIQVLPVLEGRRLVGLVHATDMDNVGSARRAS